MIVLKWAPIVLWTVAAVCGALVGNWLGFIASGFVVYLLLHIERPSR